jgi:hypothetical protein
LFASVKSLRGEYGCREHRKKDSRHCQYSSKNVESRHGSNVWHVMARTTTYPSNESNDRGKRNAEKKYHSLSRRHNNLSTVTAVRYFSWESGTVAVRAIPSLKENIQPCPFTWTINALSELTHNPVRQANKLPAGTNAVFQHRRAVFGDGDDELGREGRSLGVLVGGREHLPIAADGFVHLHGDGAVFVIA